MKIEYTISATYFVGENNDEETVTEDKTGTAEEIKVWIDGFERHLEEEAIRASKNVIPEEPEEQEEE